MQDLASFKLHKANTVRFLLAIFNLRWYIFRPLFWYPPLQMRHQKVETSLEAGQSGIILPRNLPQNLPARQRANVQKMTFSVYKEPKFFSVSTRCYDTHLFITPYLTDMFMPTIVGDMKMCYLCLQYKESPSRKYVACFQISAFFLFCFSAKDC